MGKVDPELVKREQGRRLALAREHKGFATAAEAAAFLRYKTPTTYQQHENGTRGITRAVKEYAEAFSVPEEWLLYGRNPPGWAPSDEGSEPVEADTSRTARIVSASSRATSIAPLGAVANLEELRAYIRAAEAPRDRPPPNRLRAINREIPVVGEVAAGVWKEAAVRVLDDVDEFLALDVQGYERAQLRAMKVVGPSMNLIYPEGRYVIVAHPSEAGLRSGDIVIVERHRADLVELTLKQFVVEEDGRAVLWPRSTDERYQEPIYLKAKVDADDERQIGPQIVGVVVADYGTRQRPPMYLKN